MSDAIITIENLSKKYLVPHQPGARGHSNYLSLRDVLGRQARNLARTAIDVAHGRQVRQGDEVEEFWALKNVSFKVKEGEVLGIIGRNGAGKSTLLKILSRITEPTRGRVVLRGRASSLLEVGTGFHPELTGRENIFLNGAILGMTRTEIKRKFDEIVSFAEVEKFLDTPVKRYSSGMYMRLAFAVAAHLEPEILIVDEVLAVGDAGFQKKCLAKMNEVSRDQGRTVLFVSHSMGAVTSLCPNVIWLDRGSIQDRGAASGVVSKYLSHHSSDRKRFVSLADIFRGQWLSDDRLRLRSIEWLYDLPLRHGEPVKARIRFRTRAPLTAASVGVGFSTLEGVRQLTYETDFQEGYRPDLLKPGDYSVDLSIPAFPLAPDIYLVDVGSRSGDSHQLDFVGACAEVEVIVGPKTPGYIARKGAGVRLTGEWSWEATEPMGHLHLIPSAGCR